MLRRSRANIARRLRHAPARTWARFMGMEWQDPSSLIFVERCEDRTKFKLQVVFTPRQKQEGWRLTDRRVDVPQIGRKTGELPYDTRCLITSLRQREDITSFTISPKNWIMVTVRSERDVDPTIAAVINTLQRSYRWNPKPDIYEVEPAA